MDNQQEEENQNHIKKRKLETTTMESEPKGEIFVLPFFGQGHLFPAMELCKNISSHSYNVTLIIPTHLSSSVPSTFATQSSFIHVAEIPVAASPPDSGSEKEAPPHPHRGSPLEAQNKQMGEGIKSFMSSRQDVPLPTCVVLDVMMSWSKQIFVDYNIPVVSFSTSGATSSAMGYGRWKAKIGDIKPGEIRELPGLPTEMAATFDDLNRGPRGRGGPGSRGGGRGGGRGRGRGGGRGRGRPGPDDKPKWVDDVGGSVALLINTCEDLEGLFIEYIAEQLKLPVYGVGPLLPEQFWKSAGSLLHDSEMRSNHKSNYTEHEVIQWLEAKPSGSVIYISFGSEVGPSIEEYKELAKALEESDQAFIWVIQPGSGKTGMPRSFLGPVNTDSEEEEEGYYPEGLDTKVGGRGLIITGWAPQLLILSHPSTGGFLSHCGWNSTVEAIGRGIPILGWPLRGDQFDNAKLLTTHLQIGFTMSSVDGRQGRFNKEDIAAGIKKLMTDEKVHNQVKKLGKEFEGGFPASSVKALGAFVEFISQKAA
uniref:beta-D-glucosyl crocetin beta-1,6-glucosyltransferase-like n=1 Tax=Erigeron canadensis TaxID=72917 RepID=UPI001CB89787|nr:beta-D-glucosyl crocetin beta-1,6-glucosyltransferase-like [Erigeron canadensis]